MTQEASAGAGTREIYHLINKTAHTTSKLQEQKRKVSHTMYLLLKEIDFKIDAHIIGNDIKRIVA